MKGIRSEKHHRQLPGDATLPEASTLQSLNSSSLSPLPRSFYEPAASAVAPLLLGHYLIHNIPESPCAGLIVETEAYLANDPACHGFRGESQRNRAMYGPPGHAYVYFIYGNHWCFNAVCRPKGHAEAVLIRAVEPVVGEDAMRGRRPAVGQYQLTNGPGKLCEALGIDRKMDGADLCDAKSPVFIARHPQHDKLLREQGPIVTTTRIGITKAAHLPLRFYLEGSRWVSRRIPTAIRK